MSWHALAKQQLRPPESLMQNLVVRQTSIQDKVAAWRGEAAVMAVTDWSAC